MRLKQTQATVRNKRSPFCMYIYVVETGVIDGRGWLMAIVSRFSLHCQYYSAYVCLLLDLGARYPVVFCSSFSPSFGR